MKTESNMTNSLNSKLPNSKKCSKNNDSYVTHGVQLLTYINELNKIKEAALARRERGLPGEHSVAKEKLNEFSPENYRVIQNKLNERK